MAKKDFLSYLLIFFCIFLLLIIGKFFNIINTGMSSNDDCIVGLSGFNFTFIHVLSLIGLWFIVGLLPFGFGFLLYFLVDKYCFNSYLLDIDPKSINSKKEPNLLYKFITISLIPLPIFIYDLLFCY